MLQQVPASEAAKRASHKPVTQLWPPLQRGYPALQRAHASHVRCAAPMCCKCCQGLVYTTAACARTWLWSYWLTLLNQAPCPMPPCLEPLRTCRPASSSSREPCPRPHPWQRAPSAGPAQPPGWPEQQRMAGCCATTWQATARRPRGGAAARHEIRLPSLLSAVHRQGMVGGSGCMPRM